MNFSGVVLAFGLTVLSLALLAWFGGWAFLRQKVRFADAATAGLLMVVLGGIGAVILGLVYQMARPEGAPASVKRIDLFGFPVDVHSAAVWVGGLLIGYFLALELTVGGKWGRRFFLALVAAVATPMLLIGSEIAVRKGEQVMMASVLPSDRE